MSSTTTPARAVEEQATGDLYNSDVYSWSVKQADALRRRDFAAVDTRKPGALRRLESGSLDLNRTATQNRGTSELVDTSGSA